MFSAIPFVHQGLARTTPGDAIFLGVKREAGQTFFCPLSICRRAVSLKTNQRLTGLEAQKTPISR
jgi:hypothetical protein